jgi:hypothetical protein
MLLKAFRVYTLFNDLSSVATGAAYGIAFTILCVTVSTCSFFIFAHCSRTAQTQYCILRLGEKGLWTQLWSNNLRTFFRDPSLFLPLRIRLGAQ